jgi:CBS domain containing-hemolysin-like protein
MSSAAILLTVYVGSALGASFLCSILEAALLSVRELELLQRADQGDAGAARLLAIKRDRIDDAISSILTVNTIAHTVGATLAGAQAAIVFSDAWVGAFSAVLTLLVLVLTEIIPKTLGTVHASRLVGFVGGTTGLMMKAATPLLLVTRLLTRALTRHKPEETVSHREVAALVSVAAQQGGLRRDISIALSNLLRFDEVRVYDIMTPRTVLAMQPVDATVEDLLRDESRGLFSRIPLYEGTPDHVIGYVLVRQVLSEAARTEDRTTPLRDHVRKVRFVPETTKLNELLHRLIEWREHMALAVDEFGGVSGLVTLEDAVETILGREILDELDKVPNLRAMATELRDRRMKRHVVADATDEGDPPAQS